MVAPCIAPQVQKDTRTSWGAFGLVGNITNFWVGFVLCHLNVVELGADEFMVTSQFESVSQCKQRSEREYERCADQSFFLVPLHFRCEEQENGTHRDEGGHPVVCINSHIKRCGKEDTAGEQGFWQLEAVQQNRGQIKDRQWDKNDEDEYWVDHCVFLITDLFRIRFDFQISFVHITGRCGSGRCRLFDILDDW